MKRVGTFRVQLIDKGFAVGPAHRLSSAISIECDLCKTRVVECSVSFDESAKAEVYAHLVSEHSFDKRTFGALGLAMPSAVLLFLK